MSTTLQKKVQGQERPGGADGVAVPTRHALRRGVGKPHAEKKHRKKSIRVNRDRVRVSFPPTLRGLSTDAESTPEKIPRRRLRKRNSRAAKPRTARIFEPGGRRIRTPGASRAVRNAVAHSHRDELSGTPKRHRPPKGGRHSNDAGDGLSGLRLPAAGRSRRATAAR